MTVAKTWGIEIECIIPKKSLPGCSDRGRDRIYPEDKLKEILREKKLSRYWKVHDDQSIRPGNNNYGLEIVSVPMDYTEANFARIGVMCDFLKSLEASVNTSCGLHVHVGIKGITPEHIRAIMVRYANHEHVIDRWFPRHRRKNMYCTSMKKAHIDSEQTTIKDFVRTYGTNNERYSKVNGCSYDVHGTLEFRQHHATIDANEIVEWVKFCVEFVKASQTSSKNFVASSTKPLKIYDVEDIKRPFRNYLRDFPLNKDDFQNTWNVITAVEEHVGSFGLVDSIQHIRSDPKSEIFNFLDSAERSRVASVLEEIGDHNFYLSNFAKNYRKKLTKAAYTEIKSMPMLYGCFFLQSIKLSAKDLKKTLAYYLAEDTDKETTQQLAKDIDSKTVSVPLKPIENDSVWKDIRDDTFHHLVKQAVRFEPKPKKVA